MHRMIKGMVGLVLAGDLLFGGAFPATAGEKTAGPQALAKLIEGAKKEGGFSLYHSPTNTDINMFLEAFTRKYPFLKATTYRAGSVSLINRVVAERKANANKWDVIILNSLFLHQLKREGALQRYAALESAGYGKGFKDDQGFWYGLFINAQVIGYNTRIVKPQDVPKSFMDLLEPRWKGKIAIDAEPYEWITCLEQEWGRAKARNYVERLAQQKLSLRRGRSLLVQLLAAGEFPLAIPIYSYRVEQMKKEGAPIEWVAADPVSANMLGIALAEHPNKPNTARLFLEFTLSEEGQRVVGAFSRIPARLEVKPNPPRLTEGIRLVPSDPSISDDIQRVLREFDADVRRNK